MRSPYAGIEAETRIYDRLGVTLTQEHIHGESAYNEALPGVITQLDAAGLLTESEGAQCVFLDEFRTKLEALAAPIEKDQNVRFDFGDCTSTTPAEMHRA